MNYYDMKGRNYVFALYDVSEEPIGSSFYMINDSVVFNHRVARLLDNSEESVFDTLKKFLPNCDSLDLDCDTSNFPESVEIFYRQNGKPFGRLEVYN